MITLKTVSLLTLMVFGSGAQFANPLNNLLQASKSVPGVKRAKELLLPDLATENPAPDNPTSSGPLPGLFGPIASAVQRIASSSQGYLRERIAQLTKDLKTYNAGQDRETVAEQLRDAELLLRLADAGGGPFTNRLEPAGFLGGNGWLANKGGLYGTPGALLSPGGLFTDYPTAYRKK